jgi:hypothetical protein
LKQVVKKEGLSGLYVGMESTFWRYVTLSPHFFPLYSVGPDVLSTRIYDAFLSLSQTFLVERRLLRVHFSGTGLTTQSRGVFDFIAARYLGLLINCVVQSQQAQLMNNFISGAVGGFVGTALNTP